MNKTKIDWCDSTVNPVVGCPNGCPYCYARKINNRFHYIEEWSEPQFFADRLKQFASEKPKSIFIDSMSDAGCWQYEWFKAVMDATQANPQHNYILLTKKPDHLLAMKLQYLSKCTELALKNVYFGATITSTQAYKTGDTTLLKYMDFLSIEPLLAPIRQLDAVLRLGIIKTIIIGAETGNRKNKVTPKKEWVDDIVRVADEYGQKVFMKESLREIMGADFRQDRLIWEIAK